jgi:hypothetical protein
MRFPLTRRCLILVGVLWLCFLTKLVFYSSFVPLWEGYDEFSHFAFVQYLAVNHELPAFQNSNTSEEVAESLRLAPVPWTIRQWTAGWITHDDFWRLPAVARQQRESELEQIPDALARERASDLRLYEAQQPPLAYLLYLIPYTVFERTDLPTRVWVIRITGSAIASLVIPFGFIAGRRVLRNELHAAGVVAVVAAMPELMMTADHGGNEPLAIVLGTACIYALTLVVDMRRSFWPAMFLGCLLGCALLTKAYFLTLIPAIIGIHAIVVWRNPGIRKRSAVQLLITFAIVVAIAGWWYRRAINSTGALTGGQIAVAARQSGTPLLRALKQIDWSRAGDFALFSHIWLGGWSFLVLRAWMYRIVEFVLLAACVGLAFRFRKVGSMGLCICIASQCSFWAGLTWYAFSTYLATGESAVFGYYAYALVVPETVCIIAGISALIPVIRKRFVVPALVVPFAAAEIYGTVYCLMPYYAGLTAHNRGTVPAVHASRFLNGGAAELFRNLGVNKPHFLSAGVLLALCGGFLLAIGGVVTVSVLLASLGERGEAGTGAANRFVPLRSG